MKPIPNEPGGSRADSSNPPLASARRAGDWIAVSGQLGIRDGRLVAGGPGPETAQALDNLRLVLEGAGASLRTVQKVNVYLTSMKHYADMNLAYAEAFDQGPLPARTAIAVLGLPQDATVEIEAWATSTTDRGAR